MLKWIIKKYLSSRLQGMISKLPLAVVARWANYVSASADRLAQAAGDGDITEEEVDELLTTMLTIPTVDD